MMVKFQFTVQATDNGVIQRTSTARVTVRITREGSPTFDRAEYQVTIGEDTAINTQVFDVNAVDPRVGVSCSYSKII